MPRYLTLTWIDGCPEAAWHPNLAEAERFAAEVAAEGAACHLLLLMRAYEEEGLPDGLMRTATGPVPDRRPMIFDHRRV